MIRNVALLSIGSLLLLTSTAAYAAPPLRGRHEILKRERTGRDIETPLDRAVRENRARALGEPEPLVYKALQPRRLTIDDLIHANGASSPVDPARVVGSSRVVERADARRRSSRHDVAAALRAMALEQAVVVERSGGDFVIESPAQKSTTPDPITANKMLGEALEQHSNDGSPVRLFFRGFERREAESFLHNLTLRTAGRHRAMGRPLGVLLKRGASTSEINFRLAEEIDPNRLQIGLFLETPHRGGSVVAFEVHTAPFRGSETRRLITLRARAARLTKEFVAGLTRLVERIIRKPRNRPATLEQLCKELRDELNGFSAKHPGVTFNLTILSQDVMIVRRSATVGPTDGNAA